jgi:hypothetical protein
MTSFVYTADVITEDYESEIFLLTIAGLVFLLLLALVVVCFCRRRAAARDRPPSQRSDPDHAVSQTTGSVANLIPPLFYTEGLRDPLMQEDLRDRLRNLDQPPHS